VLPNAWDVTSALLVAEAGFAAVATSSGACARALGFDDHEAMPPDEAFAVIGRIARSVDVPVTADIESGYGLAPDEIVGRLVDAGAVGCNLEDTDHRAGAVREVDDAAARIAEVRAAADRAGVPIVVNARVDVFLRDFDDLSVLDEAIERGRAYLAAGADCTYPIALGDAGAIERYVAATGCTNVMLRPGSPSVAELDGLGVRRVSTAAALQRAAQRHLRSVLTDLREGSAAALFGDA
jgi:2-methylisocitrate lyase-like PEP mutase family enzyme